MARPTFIPLTVLALLAGALPAQNLIRNGSVKTADGWRGGASKDQVAFDPKTGAAAPGSLRIRIDDPAAGMRSWSRSFAPPAQRPCRVLLEARVRARDLGAGAQACPMVQIYDDTNKAVGYAWCDATVEDGDWRTVSAVFDVPAKCSRINLIAYFIGPGEVWFDDFRATKTKRPITNKRPPARPQRDKPMERMVRGAAREIPWRFDLRKALEEARSVKRPVLVYLRCHDRPWKKAVDVASVEAPGIPFSDDGYKKDVLFRAGPLSDPSVAYLASHGFIPACVTYRLAGLGDGRMRWTWTPFARTGLQCWLDADVGSAAPGSLRVEANGVRGDDAAFVQVVPRHQLFRGAATLRAHVRTADLSAGAEVRVRARQGDRTWTSPPITDDGDWRDVEVEISGVTRRVDFRVELVVTGTGRAFFDDLSLKTKSGAVKPEMLSDGAVPVGGVPWDPMRPFGGSCADVATPALWVVLPDGRVHRRLHRLGPYSDDFVRRWLNDVLIETKTKITADPLGPRALDPVHGLVREGKWERALLALKGHEGDAAVRSELGFLRGWCQMRLGRLEEAFATWRASVGNDRFGRRAAACVLPTGPHLWVSGRLRAWPEKKIRVETTETGGVDGFSARASLNRLVELQLPDGSFAEHGTRLSSSTTTGSYWQPAITGLAAEAIRRWMHQVEGEDRLALEEAHQSAIDWLIGYSGKRQHGLDSFNVPYVVPALVGAGEKAAVAGCVRRLVDDQQADGSWTVYGPKRPTSFNTALALIALHQARAAGVEVPARVLLAGTRALAGMREQAKGDLFSYSPATGHGWMTTAWGAIGRDPLCEHALLLGGQGDPQRLIAALARFATHHAELRHPSKKLYDGFNTRAHGGYFFLFCHRSALDAAAHADDATKVRIRQLVHDAVLRTREGDDTFMDHVMLNRAYGTAMALCILAPAR